MHSPSTVTLHRDALLHGWHPVALSSEIGEEPSVAWLLDERWLLRRAPDGTVTAFVDRCPHRLMPLSAGRRCDDGTLECAYHGWRFGDDGACTLIPALGAGGVIPPRARLTTPAGLAERGGIVWLAPLEPTAPLIEVPRIDDAHLGDLAPVEADADPGELIDNFLDVAHFPFVHTGTFATAESDQVDDYELTRTDTGFTAVTEHPFANHEDPAVLTGERPLIQRRRMTYTYAPPYSATLLLEYLDAGGSNLIVFAIQPLRGPTSRIYTTLARNDVAADAMPDAIDFEQRVLAEDLVIQRQLGVALPLDLTVEVHTKADRLTIELRRRLAAFLGV